MERDLGDKHVVVMAGFTVAAMVAAGAYGFKRVLRKSEKKHLVPLGSMGGLVDLEEIAIKDDFSNIPLEIGEETDVKTYTTIPLPISLPPYGITEYDIETHDDISPDKQKENKDMEMENLNACLKELQQKVAKLDIQEIDIKELKKKVKEDEEKLGKLDLQEIEINELKMKISDDENQIREMQKELIELREKNNKKKNNWWNANRGSTVHDVAASEFPTTKKTQKK